MCFSLLVTRACLQEIPDAILVCNCSMHDFHTTCLSFCDYIIIIIVAIIIIIVINNIIIIIIIIITIIIIIIIFVVAIIIIIIIIIITYLNSLIENSGSAFVSVGTRM